MRIKKPSSAFTLVELLVVIGIIALLISILLPALGKARLQAKRAQDLSNIRQIAIACVAYAAENKGQYPLGSILGPNLDTTQSGYTDNVPWVNGFTFDYFLQFMTDRKTASDWLTGPATTYALQPATQKRFACVSMWDSPASVSMFSSIGRTDYLYWKMQTDPAGLGFNETEMGFLYWGRRDISAVGPVWDQTGTQVTPTTNFAFPRSQGQRSTSNVLLTCPGYSAIGFSCWLPHAGYGYSESFVALPSTNSSIGPGNGVTDQSRIMQGICCAYTDGSAKWVPRRQLWSYAAPNSSGAINAWVYYDQTR